MSWAKYAINRWYESDTLYQRFDFEEKNDALICKEWLVDQYGFFKARIKRYGQYASYLKTGDFISKLIWLAAAIILAIVLWNSQPGENVFIFAIGIINVITLIMSYLSEKLLFKELTARYGAETSQASYLGIYRHDLSFPLSLTENDASVESGRKGRR